ncbi:hypothetical protein V502_07892 [Pseudogymnoascus sp. VKM F-4520 (FW-2644)]|nr:hypothetical protein V502_07892 [Pseudogymnoascus sp. VKM F-4520 (FW-2644)]
MSPQASTTSSNLIRIWHPVFLLLPEGVPLAVTQRIFTNSSRGKDVNGSKPKGKKAAASAKGKEKGVAGPSKDQGPSKVIVRDMDDPRQALLHHAETLVELGKAKTEGLKAATQVFHASVDKVLDVLRIDRGKSSATPTNTPVNAICTGGAVVAAISGLRFSYLLVLRFSVLKWRRGSNGSGRRSGYYFFAVLRCSDKRGRW